MKFGVLVVTVWAGICSAATPSETLVARPASATVQGVRLGQNRSRIADSLGIDTPPGESTLAARAGPFLTWDFTEASLDLVFSRPDTDKYGAAILEMVCMYRRHTLGG